ncbi:hypothetical protein [Raineyella fluvialis]|uniref:Uncharacterized protein n=1 Tax=Raineyella fluvialis TaxID=2662261 RepID=A0A5Q2FCV7_9ACTN|nr:hypothetical protein [Raineyella fluvialis]QGF24618.1 hypothetical protein Rai3103_14360 [Raineyella fluvialis]
MDTALRSAAVGRSTDSAQQDVERHDVAVEATRFGWSRWVTTDDGLERSYTVCEPGLAAWKRDVIHATLFRDDRAGMIEVGARWALRGFLAALVLGGLLALVVQSGVVIVPVALAVLVSAAVLLASLPNRGRLMAERHTVTLTGEACREVSRIAAVLDRIEPDPADIDRDDVRTMWRLAHTDPAFLKNYGRTVRDWEVSYVRLRETLSRDEPRTLARTIAQETGSGVRQTAVGAV